MSILLRNTTNGNVIQAGTSIEIGDKETVLDSAWTTVAIPAKAFKTVFSSASAFYISHVNDDADKVFLSPARATGNYAVVQEGASQTVYLKSVTGSIDIYTMHYKGD